MSDFHEFLQGQGVPDGQIPGFYDELRGLATDAQIDPEVLGRIVQFTANILTAAGVQSDSEPTAELTDEEAIEQLTSDLEIFHQLDYWTNSDGHPGHGTKPGQGRELVSPNFAHKEMDLLKCAASTWFPKEGWQSMPNMVVKNVDGELTTYLLHFNARDPISDSRPRGALITTIRNTPEYEDLRHAIEKNPAILLQVFPRIALNSARDPYDREKLSAYTNRLALGRNTVFDVSNDIAAYMQKMYTNWRRR